MSVCLYVYVASKWWCSVYLEDLAMKCVSCVRVCGCCDSVFCNVGERRQHSQCFWLWVQSTRTGGYSDVWPECESVYPRWWLRYNNVWLYQTVSMIVLGLVCVLCGCVYAIVTKTVFGSACESALLR